MGYTHLDENLVQSSLMTADPNTFKIFITLLASARPDNIAPVSSTFLAAACYMSLEDVNKSLAILESPDNYSRSLEEEGRRIRRVDGGYFIINFSKYRNKIYSYKPDAIRKREYRKKKKMGHVPDNLGQIGTPAYAYVLKNTINTTTIDTEDINTITTEIIEYLNLKTNKNYRSSNPKTRELIFRRIKIDKATIDEFKKVIDLKTADWVGTESDKYLRPETLFGTKFESYRNQKVKPTLEEAGETWIKHMEEKEAREKENDNEEKF